MTGLSPREILAGSLSYGQLLQLRNVSLSIEGVELVRPGAEIGMAEEALQAILGS